MTDRHTIQRAQAGDGAAFSALVAAYRERIYRLCYRMTGHADDADDLAHETFVEAFVKLGTLRDAAAFGGWLRAIALNLCRMRLRGQPPVADALTEELPEREPDGADPYAARVAQGLSRLSPPLRVTLVLHYLEGLSCEEVASFLGVPIGTVMSRLHRGRAALKQIVMATKPEEEPMMTDDRQFSQDVDAEIAVLLTLFREDPTAIERLSTLLQHAPERLARLIAETEDDTVLAHLGRLLRRLSGAGIEVVLSSAFTDDATTRERAVRVLGHFLARLRIAEPGMTQGAMPSSEAYRLLDAVIRSTASPASKAELLVAVLGATPDDATIALVRGVLLCDPPAALRALLPRFWAAQAATGYAVSAPVLAALALLGTPFVAALLPALTSGEMARQAVALNGLEAVARGLHARFANTPAYGRRFCGYIPPEAMDAALLDDAVARTAGLLDDPRDEIRNRAIRVLGLLRRGAHTPALEHLAVHGPDATRVAALRALAEFGVVSPSFYAAARPAHPRAERVAAIEALGRLGDADAVTLLADLLADADPTVRQSAVAALGGIGGDAARAALEAAVRSSDTALLRAAAKVLHASPHFAAASRRTAACDDRAVQRRLLGEEPGQHYTDTIHAAIGALPEARPYAERELTRYIARACQDYSTTRRELIMQKLMTRESGIYQLTETGLAVWRVERYIQTRYLA